MSKITKTANTITIRGLTVTRGRDNVDKLINDTVKQSVTFRDMLHQALVSAVDHAVGPVVAPSRDTTLISKLYNMLGNETNKGKGIGTWLGAHTNLTYREGRDKVKQWLKPANEPNVLLFNLTTEGKPILDADGKKIPVDIQDWNAIDVPFYAMEKVAKDNEVQAMVNAFEAFFAQLGKKVDKGIYQAQVDIARLAWMKDAYTKFAQNEAVKYQETPVEATNIVAQEG